MKQKINLLESLIPVVFLIIVLTLNIIVFKDEATSGPNQFALILAGALAMIIGFKKGFDLNCMTESISENIKSVTPAILTLFLVGALAGTWLISGIIPTMVYYGLFVLSPKIFLVACIIICIIVSMATGSSWTTSATIGIALMGIGESMGINSGITAGAVISGAYFGDKMSVLSETTNLAPAMAGTDVYTHIKYMMITTVPTILISIVFFSILSFFKISSDNSIDPNAVMLAISSNFNVTPWLFMVPLCVILLIIFKVSPLPSLLAGTLLGALFAIIFQQEALSSLTENPLDTKEIYKLVMTSIVGNTSFNIGNIVLENGESVNLSALFEQGGMFGMLNTVWLIISAMVFGGVMDAIGALKRLSAFFLSMFKSIFGLFASTVASCLAVNLTSSDQYLAIVIPGKMFKEAYHEKGLAPENLSRTLEDSATVTSVLIPWNTCGAYHSKVLLGQSGMVSYIPYAIFNYLSPFVTLLVAAIGYKIKRIKKA
ncbi:sodium:proton antiporter [Weeksellaceae bacterium TAE3-ERU29]|nr:sodium:proton antiporter [Weeksellaceae bacterium TAE3-ERU29]